MWSFWTRLQSCFGKGAIKASFGAGQARVNSVASYLPYRTDIAGTNFPHCRDKYLSLGGRAASAGRSLREVFGDTGKRGF
jgi:hypothetical protein